MDKASQDQIEHHFSEILKLIEPDSYHRKGLQDTPRRVAKMYGELFRGYNEDEKPIVTVFPNGEDSIIYDELVIDQGPFFSHCEHHMSSFIGYYYFAYIPHKKGNILGLSKVARVVDYFAARLQVQERLVQQIVDYLWQALGEGTKHKPKGIALVMKARHSCKFLRGVKKDGLMTTSALKGVLKTNMAAREEFLKLITLKDI